MKVKEILLRKENNVLNNNIKMEALYYVILALFTGIVGYLTLGKGIDLDTYPGFSGDSTATLAVIKGIQENGFSGIWFNDRLGAPGIQSFIDYPGFGNTMALILWVISWFTSSTPRILYTYLIVTFVLDGISMSLLLRKIKINKEVSFIISSLFAFAPYHFYRYIAHATLIDYMSMPIAMYLAFNILGIIEDEKKWKIIICTILLGLGYGYYYAFGLIVLAVAYLFEFIKLENKKEIINKFWIVGLLLLTILVSFLPKIVFSLINGSNIEAGRRFFHEQESYGLKIINLLLPVSYSRIETFKELTNSYLTSGAPLINENSLASLGLIGSIGFIILCGTLIVSFVRKKECFGGLITDFCSMTTLVFVLVSSIGGFGEIFNWAVTSQIRCYNRASIFIMGLSLIVIAVLLNQVKYKKRILSIIVCGIILGIGCFDQVDVLPSNWQDGIKDELAMYEDYFANVENSLDEGAMVYQLPYLDFPEENGFDYQHFIAYFFTDKLRWSYGGLRGRDIAAKELNIDDGMSYRFLKGLKDAGFQAVYIDVRGYYGYYNDGEEKVSQILAFYNSLGVEPLISEDGRWYVYDISGVEIPEEWLVTGYYFVHGWADHNHIDISVEAKVDLAKRLDDLDITAYEVLYSWMSSNGEILGAEDNEYIDYLYLLLLNREEGDEEREMWVSKLRDGESRENIFYSFLNSEEFRSKNRLNE